MEPLKPPASAHLAPPNVIFMPGIFNETMGLLTHAHDYFYQFGAEDQAAIDDDMRMLYTGEMSRITLRLSSIMAWLMAQRAIASGKIPSEETSQYSLDFQESCLVDNRMLHGILPPPVCTLLDQSLELYERVARLDHLLH